MLVRCHEDDSMVGRIMKIRSINVFTWCTQLLNPLRNVDVLEWLVRGQPMLLDCSLIGQIRREDA